MITKEQVQERLETVLVPAARRNIVGMNMVREVSISNKKVNITLASTGLFIGSQDLIGTKVKEAINKLPGINEVSVEYTNVEAKDLNKINHIIAVMSGKGGVGKSLVAGLTALALQRQGYGVGILDADITGPSIPKMFGVSARPSGSDTGMLPVPSKSGIDIISMNLLLPNEDDAVIWRGPLIGKAITQFWEEVLWGKLDYLIVDLPPGTADAPLTVMQSLSISGVIIVFSPQDLVEMIVRKALKMAQKMEKRVLGVVENMSYLYVPEIDKKIEVFGKSRAEHMASVAGAPLLGKLPIDPELARLCDEGNIEHYDDEIVPNLGESLKQAMSPGCK